MKQAPTPAQAAVLAYSVHQLVESVRVFDSELAQLILDQIGTTPDSIEAAFNP